MSLGFCPTKSEKEEEGTSPKAEFQLIREICANLPRAGAVSYIREEMNVLWSELGSLVLWGRDCMKYRLNTIPKVYSFRE